MEYLILFLLIVLNGIFAMSEIALVSSKRVRLEEKARKGSRGARTALRLMDEPDKFLSTVQIGITLAGIVTGAFGGIALSDDLTPILGKIPWVAPYAEKAAVVLVVVLVTYLSLIIGELVPKSIALNEPESITVILAPFMGFLSWVTTPVVLLLSFSTRLALKALAIRPKEDIPVTEEELKILIEKGVQSGTLEYEESELLKRIFRFGDRKAYSIMTNRQDVVSLSLNDTVDEIKDRIYQNPFTRYPVWDTSPDDIVGILNVKDFFHKLDTDADFELGNILTEPLFIPENLKGISIFERLRDTRTYVTVVVDEYGSYMGIITLHDLIENIFGDLPDKDEKEVVEFFVREDGSILIDGGMLIDELRERIPVDFGYTDDYITLGGFMMLQLNNIPRVGDRVEHEGHLFEIVDMDGNRVDKVLVQKVPSPEVPPSEIP